MEYKYSYTIDNLKYLDDLYNYIKTNSVGLPENFHLNIEATLDVVFNQELTLDQETLLNSIISGYIPPQELLVNVKTENIQLSQNTILPSNTYTIIGNYFYTVPDNNSFPSSFKIISLVNGNTNYKIRVYDSINDLVLCETDTLNNTNVQITILSNITNLPTNETLLEIQCIVSGDNKCTVKLVQIIYSKLL